MTDRDELAALIGATMTGDLRLVDVLGVDDVQGIADAIIAAGWHR